MINITKTTIFCSEKECKHYIAVTYNFEKITLKKLKDHIIDQMEINGWLIIDNKAYCPECARKIFFNK